MNVFNPFFHHDFEVIANWTHMCIRCDNTPPPPQCDVAPTCRVDHGCIQNYKASTTETKQLRNSSSINHCLFCNAGRFFTTSCSLPNCARFFCSPCPCVTTRAARQFSLPFLSFCPCQAPLPAPRNGRHSSSSAIFAAIFVVLSLSSAPASTPKWTDSPG
jgi:hypothetical protein